MIATSSFPLVLSPDSLAGKLRREENEKAPLPGAACYVAQEQWDKLMYRFPAGALVGANWLTADFLLSGTVAGIFILELLEGEDGPGFGYRFGLLGEAQARLRMPLEAVNQNRWLYDREGALLKPISFNSRVNLARVDRLRFSIMAMPNTPQDPDATVRWWMTPFTASVDAPTLLEDPLLPQGVLLDELGQNAQADWPGKTRDVAELTGRLQRQFADASGQQWPDDWSRWGGWTGQRYEPAGFFRTQWDEKKERWWLVDPDGCAFWSTGQDCVRSSIDTCYNGLQSALRWLPDANDANFAEAISTRRGALMVDYLKANLIRAFGAAEWHDKWAQITLAELRRTRFNTVANWSEWKVASAAGFPYVRPLDSGGVARNTPAIYRDFPDVFNPQFDADAEEYSRQLVETRDDPALIGYFLMNEPTWGFSSEAPAAGMLFTAPHCATRRALAEWLRAKYGDNPAVLPGAWGMPAATLEAVGEGAWNTPLTPAALKDLEGFSSVMVEKFFGTLSRACKKVDPHHLNLGIRYHTVPPGWALAGMRSFDVFSINCYQQNVPADSLKAIHELLNMPTLIGEWHHGALDAGLPAAGVGPRAANQAARGQAYRYYLETAAAIPWCVGVHHFTHYDQSAMGRFDGENYNIGFYDVCNRPYTEIIGAAITAHERMYAIAATGEPPCSQQPTWLKRYCF